MQRRDFIKTSLSVVALSSLPAKSLAQGTQWISNNLTDDWPIARISDNENNSLDFNGDNIDRPHDILWNIDGHIAKRGGEPAVSEEVDVVVVGGGAAGLSAAYNLRDKNTVLLEMDTRLGGNSKGELYKGSCTSIGAAYFVNPSKNSNLGRLFTDLNIWNDGRVESSDHTTVYYKNQFTSPFWRGATDRSAKADFDRVFKRISEMGNDASIEANMNALDAMTFDAWLEKEFGTVHPHLREYFQLYGWSSFCGSTDELSAYQFLGFISSEMGSLIAFPGGNSYVAQKMAVKIRREKGQNSIRSGCIVLRVETVGDSVTVLFEDLMGELRKIRAKHVIMACPKFVAKRLLPELSADQAGAIGKLMYRAYLVGNIYTKKPIQSPSYELYCLKGVVPDSPTSARRGDRNFTDICFGTWAQSENVQHSALTVYQGIAWDGARQFLFNPASHDKYKDRYLNDILPVLSSFNLTKDDIHGIRMTRWGHALPIARAGLIAEGVVQKASESIANRIHFANQDNWANPCFETSLAGAIQAAEQVK